MWIVLLIAVLAGLWLLREFANKIPRENSHWPVFARAPLTMREQFLYHRLSVMYPEHIILAQVALSQIIDVSPGTPNRQAIRGKFKQHKEQLRERKAKKTPAAKLNYPLVIIEWTDASRLSDGWMDLNEIPEPYPHRCVTVGFVVACNEHGKILVPTVGDIGHPDNSHTYGGMLIPRVAIISETKLR
jgi:hypothetical protein